MQQSAFRRASLMSLVCVLGGFVAGAPAGDWLSWRGPEQNGVSREKDLPSSWSLDAKEPNSNLVWEAPYGCRSTPLVMNGRVLLMARSSGAKSKHERTMTSAYHCSTGIAGR